MTVKQDLTFKKYKKLKFKNITPTTLLSVRGKFRYTIFDTLQLNYELGGKSTCSVNRSTNNLRFFNTDVIYQKVRATYALQC